MVHEISLFEDFLQKFLAKNDPTVVCLGVIPFSELFFLQRFHASFEPLFHRRNRRLSLRVLSFIAVFGLFSLTSARVEATCGDYLLHGHMMSHSDMLGHDLGAIDRAQSNPTGVVPFSRGPLRKPCHGPSCQQRPVQNPLPVPVITVEPQDRWGWMADVMIPAPTILSLMGHPSESVVLPAIAYRLDRPPKV